MNESLGILLFLCVVIVTLVAIAYFLIWSIGKFFTRLWRKSNSSLKESIKSDVTIQRPERVEASSPLRHAQPTEGSNRLLPKTDAKDTRVKHSSSTNSEITKVALGLGAIAFIAAVVSPSEKIPRDIRGRPISPKKSEIKSPPPQPNKIHVSNTPNINKPISKPKTTVSCYRCSGTGSIVGRCTCNVGDEFFFDNDGNPTVIRKCSTCNGQQTIAIECDYCGGSGIEII